MPLHVNQMEDLDEGSDYDPYRGIEVKWGRSDICYYRGTLSETTSGHVHGELTK